MEETFGSVEVTGVNYLISYKPMLAEHSMYDTNERNNLIEEEYHEYSALRQILYQSKVWTHFLVTLSV